MRYVYRALNILTNIIYTYRSFRLQFENYSYFYSKIHLCAVSYGYSDPYTKEEIVLFITIIKLTSAVAETATQMTLKIFHFAGVASTRNIKTLCQLGINDDEEIACNFIECDCELNKTDLVTDESNIKYIYKPQYNPFISLPTPVSNVNNDKNDTIPMDNMIEVALNDNHVLCMNSLCNVKCKNKEQKRIITNTNKYKTIII